MVQEETLNFSRKPLSTYILDEQSFYKVLQLNIFVLLHRFDDARAQMSILLHETSSNLDLISLDSQLLFFLLRLLKD